VKIGLTGTIGSGKSLVSAALRDLGAVVIDTDEVARDVVAPGTPGLLSLIGNWGPEVLAPGGTLDRKKLADIVFKDESQRIKLNAILHPLIGMETARRMAEAPPGRHIVLEVPLLFESGFDRLVDVVWVVAADEEMLVRRVCERDAAAEPEVRARMRAQMPQQEKIRRAHIVIYNNGSIEDTKRQTAEAWNNLEKL
jgi:dephospho-CoA kinase